MLKASRLKKVLVLMLAISLVVLAGCQAILGVDFNQALKNSLKVTSTEGNSSFQFKLKLNEAVLENEEDTEYVELLRLLSDVKVSLTDMKAQDEYTVSFNGNVSLGDETSIDFGVKLNEKLAVFTIEGGKNPFSFDLTGETAYKLMSEYYYNEYGIDYDEDEEYPLEYAIEDEAMIAAINEITNIVASYGIDKLPNVERVSLTPTIESINGVNTNVAHVQGELNGMEVWGWAKKLVDGLLADRAGLEKMLTEVIQIVTDEPALYEYLGLYYYEPGEIEFDEMDKTKLTKEVVGEAIDALNELKLEMQEVEVENKKELEQVLNDSLKIKFDYYVDSKLDIRKQKVSIDYEIAQEWKDEFELNAIDGFSIITESEVWNVNGDVVAEEPKLTNQTVSLESLDYLKGYEILRLFEEDSYIYNFLKDTVQISYQSYYDWANESDLYSMYINESNVAMVPLVNVANLLAGELSYDAATKQVTYFDAPKGNTIVMKLGSDIAVVNGESVKWTSPVIAKDGITFAPIRGLAEALEAELRVSGDFVRIHRIP